MIDSTWYQISSKDNNNKNNPMLMVRRKYGYKRYTNTTVRFLGSVKTDNKNENGDDIVEESVFVDIERGLSLGKYTFQNIDGEWFANGKKLSIIVLNDTKNAMDMYRKYASVVISETILPEIEKNENRASLDQSEIKRIESNFIASIQGHPEYKKCVLDTKYTPIVIFLETPAIFPVLLFIDKATNGIGVSSIGSGGLIPPAKEDMSMISTFYTAINGIYLDPRSFIDINSKNIEFAVQASLEYGNGDFVEEYSHTSSKRNGLSEYKVTPKKLKKLHLEAQKNNPKAMKKFEFFRRAYFLYEIQQALPKNKNRSHIMK